MSKIISLNTLSIELSDGETSLHPKINIQILRDNEYHRIWYRLYKLDQILETGDYYKKVKESLEEDELLDNNNYLEYINYSLSNYITGSDDTSMISPLKINNYSEFIFFISTIHNNIESNSTNSLVFKFEGNYLLKNKIC